MFCKNCGNEINENAKFCPKCGAAVTPDTATDFSPEDEHGATAKTQKKRRFWIPIVIIVAAVVVALIVLAATGILTRKTINLNDYVNVEIDGYDGHGKAIVSLDINELGEDYDGKIKLSDEATAKGYHNVSKLIDNIVDISASPNSNLSNGDEVALDWSVNENTYDELLKKKVKLTYEPETFEVTGLESINSFDAFAGVSVEFSGISPEASAKINYDHSAVDIPEDAWNDLKFSLNQSSSLSIGDTVTVTISEASADELAQTFGIYPEEMSKDFEVEGISYYVSSLDQIPEDAMNKMLEDSQPATSTENFEGTMSAEYIGCWFLYEKPGHKMEDVNLIYIIYKEHIYGIEESGGVDEFDCYLYVCYRNGIMLDDGTFSIDYDDYSIPEGSYDRWTGTVNGEGFVVDGLKTWFSAYEDYDSMLNNVVTSKLDNYTYENTVENQ